MAETKQKTTTATARKRTTAAKATASKPAPGGAADADSGPRMQNVPLVSGVPLPSEEPGGDMKSPVDLGAELSMPFDHIIGGPLQGVIRASAMAANETAKFIRDVGFNKEGNVETVKFKYTSTEPTTKEGVADTKKTVKEVEVPLLSVVPIPYLQLSKVTLDFSVKIDSVSTQKHDTQIGGSAEASGGFWGITASVKASYDNSSSSSDTVTRNAAMSVHVEAEQGPMPAGMEKILSMLTDNAVTVEQTAT
ncbi:DUF2589 domain-containing protein [Streptomyces sp. NPDC100445]|uniref:DUF2589 domain-containing protein n=1 Tax=Streptomyces sp. NPDC100445 TaxID=3366102 RepID=UPI0037F13FDF